MEKKTSRKYKKYDFNDDREELIIVILYSNHVTGFFFLSYIEHKNILKCIYQNKDLIELLGIDIFKWLI